MALKEVKGSLLHKNMIASGGITSEPETVRIGPGIVIGVMFVCLFAVATIVMVTAPLWFNPQ